jgi:hypothetical protein
VVVTSREPSDSLDVLILNLLLFKPVPILRRVQHPPSKAWAVGKACNILHGKRGRWTDLGASGEPRILLVWA